MSPTVYRSVLTWAALCVGAGLLAVSIRAADDAGAKAPERNSATKPQSEVGNKKTGDAETGGTADQAENSKRTPVEEALEKSIQLAYVATPLKDVAQAISLNTGINVILDVKALNEANIAPDTEITFFCDRPLLRTALRTMLDQYDLGYIVATDNTLMITTKAKCLSEMVAHVYDVKDLASPNANENDGAAGGFSGCGPGGRQKTSGSGGCIDSEEPEFDSLLDAMTSCVAPTTWTQSGGGGSIVATNGKLAILQTGETHRQIKALLADLKSAAKQTGAPAPEAVRVNAGRTDHESKLNTALNARADFDFVATPLKDVAEYLRKLSVPVILDGKGLGEASITPDTEITFQAKNIRVADGLRLILHDMETNYWVDDGFVLITSEAKYKEHVVPAVYPVGDLLKTEAESDGNESPNYDQLIEVITGTVLPTSWAEAGGNAAIASVPSARALVISQTDEGHRACAKLLAELRAVPHSQKKPADPNEMVVRRYRLTTTSKKCVKIIKSTIEPKKWSAEGVFVAALDDGLVIRQTRQVQSQVHALLKQLDLLIERSTVFQGSGLSGASGFNSGASGGGNGSGFGGSGFGNNNGNAAPTPAAQPNATPGATPAPDKSSPPAAGGQF